MGVNENIQYIRENFSKKYAENIAKGDYDARDLQRLQNDTEFACTYIRGDHRLDEGVDLLHSSFKFRNEMKINDLTEADFGKDVIDLGGLYFHKKDKQGHRILWLKVKVHKKDASAEFLTMEKKGIAFIVEKAFYNNPFSQVVVLLDMTNCGLVNMDIDFVQYIISLFKFYYPTFLAYILIYDMPWIFNAAWRVIKSWLSAEAVAKIKFVTKTDIQNYISPEDLPPYMGGTDTFQFVYVPGMSDHSPYPEDKTYKKVHFLEAQEDTRSIDLSLTKVESESDLSLDHNYNKPVLRHRSAGNRNNNSSDVRPMYHMQGFTTPGILFISPVEELVFQVGDGGDSFDMISLTNSLPVPVAFKVKTTAPEKFRVRPSFGIIKPDKKEEVYVYLVPDHNADVTKDKFLVMAMETTVTNVADPNTIFKDAPREKIMQHKMRCTTVSSKDKRVTSPDENLTSKEKQRSTISSPSTGKKFMSNTGSPAGRETYQSQPSRHVQKKADGGGEDLDKQVEQLEKQTKSLQMQLRLLMCVQFVTAFALILVMLAYSCYGEELFSRFLALPFDFCNDPYGRKC